MLLIGMPFSMPEGVFVRLRPQQKCIHVVLILSILAVLPWLLGHRVNTSSFSSHCSVCTWESKLRAWDTKTSYSHDQLLSI